MSALLRLFACVFAAVAALLAGIPRCLALQPDEILLLTNKNIPQSTALAEFYRNSRGIPQGRVLPLALPVHDEITFAAYEQDVVPVVRDFIRARNLEGKIRCIVTFYGVPLRIAAHALTPAERDEIGALLAEQTRQSDAVRLILDRMEREAQAVNPAFRPLAGMDPLHLEQRVRAALGPLAMQAARTEDPAGRAERMKGLAAYLKELGGPAEVLRVFGEDGLADPNSKEQFAEIRRTVGAATTEIGRLEDRRFDPESRTRIRKLIGDVFGRVDLLRVIQAQIDYLKPENTTAAFDSELALLWWNYYPRSGWQVNPMFYEVSPMAAQRSIVMTSRLDAAQAGEVRQMILASLKAEREGLRGKVVLDSRSIKADGEQAQPGKYGWYDQSIRNLAEIIRTKTKLSVLHDVSPAVLPPNSAANVALYCGWYSVRNYVPACRFNAGAVGFHVASFELVSLRAPDEKGWCRGLISDGISATLGSVAEPYLIAFPAADDFFPLLMTGKLPLAEVYWRTNRYTSWQMSLIGDPLYTPFEKNPALRVEDLPERLRPIFGGPTTVPSTRPATRPATAPAEP
ncbi:MAG: TIGR03790 family protein [Tepidisphaerales bacterium]